MAQSVEVAKLDPAGSSLPHENANSTVASVVIVIQGLLRC